MKHREQHFLSPKPFDAVSYGIYIESLLAGEDRPRVSLMTAHNLNPVEDTNRLENEADKAAVEHQAPGADTRRQRGGDLAMLRRNARKTDRDELTALAEAHGWTRITPTTYDKAGWPQLDIPAVLTTGDALAVINAVGAENAAGGE